MLMLDAPRELVFKAWIEPAQVAQWWGPSGFTNSVCELDARQGGKIRIVMCVPNGVDYPMSGTFREIVPPHRLVFTAVAEDAEGKPILESLTTVSFVEIGGKTELTMHRMRSASLLTPRANSRECNKAGRKASTASTNM